jgi:hypothetical protein
MHACIISCKLSCHTPSSQTEKFYFAQEMFFPWESCAEMSNIFTEHLFQKVLLSKRKIRNLLGSWFTKAYFVTILQKLFADNFAHGINFLQSQNFTVWP